MLADHMSILSEAWDKARSELSLLQTPKRLRTRFTLDHKGLNGISFQAFKLPQLPPSYIWKRFSYVKCTTIDEINRLIKYMLRLLILTQAKSGEFCRKVSQIMPLLKTPGFEGTSIKFSPFFDTRLAVSTGQNYAIIGNGRQYVLELTPHGISEVCFYDTNEILLDCTWCECNENLLLSASGNGSLKMWDTARPPAANPIASLEEHTHDACSVDWNPLRKDCFLSSSWDNTIKLWTINRPISIRTFTEHTHCAYVASWNPRHADVFASASGDCTLRCWDVRNPTSVLVISAHDLEILSCDWNKYDESLLVTGSVDRSIRVWDVRNHLAPIAVMQGHSQAVKRVKFSPHHENLVGSCSYDMAVCMWDFVAPENALLARYDHHTEFTTGFDMSLHEDNLLASVSYDDCVYVWPHGFDPRA